MSINVTFSSAAFVDSDWTFFKQVLSSKRVKLQNIEDEEKYTLFCFDSRVAYRCILYKNDASSQADIVDLLTNYSEWNEQIDIVDEIGRPQFVANPRIGEELIAVSHNFADPCTWYKESVRVENQPLSQSSQFVWSTEHNHLIDAYSGRFYRDYVVRQDVQHQYSVDVTVNGQPKFSRQPFANSGGDYIVNYESGTITSTSDWTGMSVSASYSYASGSGWHLTPASGKRIDIEEASVQITTDIEMTDTIEFRISAYNPFDLPNKMIVTQDFYHRVQNIVDEALGNYAPIPKIGGSSRGLNDPIVEFPFKYNMVRSMRSSQGVDMCIRLVDDIKFGGSYCTVTFYCTVHDEVV